MPPSKKYHTAAPAKATKATQPITIPAMAPPLRLLLLLVGLDTGEGVGASGVVATVMVVAVEVTNKVAPGVAAALVCKFVVKLPELTEDSS